MVPKIIACWFNCSWYHTQNKKPPCRNAGFFIVTISIPGFNFFYIHYQDYVLLLLYFFIIRVK